MRVSCSRQGVVSIFVVAVSLGGLGGCSWFSSDKGPLTAAADSPISDAPVPKGFMRTPDSTSRQIPDNNLRMVDHRYKGSADVLPVVKFYKETMPEKGWKAGAVEESKNDQVTLHFTKNKENCDVMINKGGFPSYETYIQIKIDPIGRDMQKP